MMTMRFALMVLLLSWPAAAAARQAAPPSDPERVTVSEAPPAARAPGDDAKAWFAAGLDTAAAQAAARKIRRPSMVGYIEDPTVASRVRIRFDIGSGNDVPDRAEFFYAKCGCYQLDPPPFFDPNAPGPGPGVPTELNFQQFSIYGEYAARDRVSLFAELPIRSIQPQGFLDFGPDYAPFPDFSGLADIRFGAKGALVADEDRDVTVQLRLQAPTGDAAKGLSTNTWSIEPALLYQERLTERVRLEAQLGLWVPLDGSAGVDSPDKFSGKVLFYGFGPSFDVVTTDRWRLSPVVELVGWRVLDGFQTECTLAGCEFDASGTNIVNLKIGARASMTAGHSFYAGYGWALTEKDWYDNIFRLEYRFGF